MDDEQRSAAYDEFITHPVSRRRELYQDLPAEVRSGLWLEQLIRFRAARPDLTAEQRSLLDEMEALVRDETTFAPGSPPAPELERMGEAAIAAFGKDTAFQLLARLGPADGTTRRIA
ncbi:bacteriocin fulvocin C-related protein [Nonomuraea fastidiosa]|uniref:bacteriocin fulvocin C-related protein n=1 Tax=Nonomuraea TaxID=83681 RepID=UPI00325621A6